MIRDARRMAQEVVAVVRRTELRSAGFWLLALVRSLPRVIASRTLLPADQAWADRGAHFRLGGARVALPGIYAVGAREMYCRDVYLRSGLAMPTVDWVIDLGANRGLFSVWAACGGAKAVAVEAQEGFRPLIEALALHNNVSGDVFVETAMIGSDAADVAPVGVLQDEERWRTASHASGERPPSLSMPDLFARYSIERVGLMKVDIEGGEFAVFDPAGDLDWLGLVDQVALELHPEFGDVAGLVSTLTAHGYHILLTDNEGDAVTADHPEVAYAYARR